MSNRRNFIKQAGLLSSAAFLSGTLPEVIQRAMAIEPTPGSTFYDAEHVVFLMQENRSFDHMFGTLKGVRGFNDPRPHVLPNKDQVWLQRDDKGNAYAPFHLDLNKTKVTWQGGLAHSWPDQIAAFNKGKYDKWVPHKSSMCLGHYTRKDLPFYYALADAFTICDHYFCSSLTGTTPNRLFFWTGNVRSKPSDLSKRAVVNNSQAESHTNTYVDFPSFPELLEDNGVTWRVYQNELWTARLKGEVDDWCGNYGDNALEYVTKHQVRLASYFRKHGDKHAKPPLSAEEVTARYNALSQREKNLIDKTFTTNEASADYLDLAPFSFENEKGEQEVLQVPKGDLFYQFRKDVKEGKLPTVSWLVAPQRFSDHTSSPLYGTWYVSEALHILTQNPELWKKTIFIINYDENDGYFDHIPPYVVPEKDNHSSGKVSEGIDVRSDYDGQDNSPIGLGYRVPMLVCSPWSRGGFVNSQVFDHTSTLMFLEKFLNKKKGLSIYSPQISSWRRTVCGDMTSLFREQKRPKTDSPKPLKRDAVIGHIQEVKSNPRQLRPKPLTQVEIDRVNQYRAFVTKYPSVITAQEKGIKPACSLPYSFAVNSKLDKVANRIELDFSVASYSVGVPFRVVALGTYRNDRGQNWNYAVKSGDDLSDYWPIVNFEGGNYDLAVQGPNGFYRRFKGTSNDPDLLVRCEYEINSQTNLQTGNLLLTLQNHGKVDLQVKLTDDDYHSKHPDLLLIANSEQQVVIDTKKYHHWYNLAVAVLGFDSFQQIFAGHVEIDKDTCTDSLMGANI